MENNSKKPGRPKVDNPLKMRCIRVADDEWQAWEAAAGGPGKVSAWIRAALTRAAKRARGKG